MTESSNVGFKPPYMSFQTFWNFLSELASKPLPPKLDRSIMTSKSGTDQNNIMSALEVFDFVDESGAVLPKLQGFVTADADERKAVLRSLLSRTYAPAFKVSDANGTPNDLKEVFRDAYDVSGDTQRKAITFFLHAAREAGFELSPHFPKTRSGSGAPGTPKVKRAPARRKSEKPRQQGPTDSLVNGNAAGHTQTVQLRSGGTITLSYDVNMFEVTDEDEQFVLGLIKSLRDYKSAAPAQDVDDSEGGVS
ncbi:DUF5343 domain-containing protein [Kribbella sp. NPDC051952]|uniref:DUF5343 domain-containing protein n=1 Tax=Kribbella sp. NPDC051952 TaxID=3154851 RepID=UPI00342C4A3D